MPGPIKAERTTRIGMRNRPGDLIRELPILRMQSIPLMTRMARVRRKTREETSIRRPIRIIPVPMSEERGLTEEGET